MISEADLLGRFEGVRRLRDDEWMVLCPAHADRNPSLHVTRKDDRWLLCCQADCEQKDVLDAARLDWSDLFAERRNGHREIVAEYDYTDERGELLYQVVRFEPKDFRQRRPNGAGGWTWKLDGTRRVLYRLSRVLEAARRGETVFVVEGEKDVYALERAGVVATCNPGGAGKWRRDYCEALRGTEVVIVADRDEAGRKHAREIADSLRGVCPAVSIVEPTVGKDAADHLAAGRTLGELAPAKSDPAALLDDLAGFVRRYVAMTEAQAAAVVLWVAHTYSFNSADSTPYLAVTSAEKRSGKSRLLEVLERLVARPWLTGRVTAAVLVRKVDAETPTLLLDESDAAFKVDSDYSEALRGVLNTGHRRGGKASLCVGQGANITFRDFTTFAPKAISGIGDLPDTVADRAIPIRLERRAPGERIQRFRYRDVEPAAAELRERLAAFSQGVADELETARPDLPDGLDDRAQDACEPILAIADLAADTWPDRARRALLELYGGRQPEDDSIGTRLLSDIRSAFAEDDRLSSADLLERLHEIDEAPWADWYGKPFTSRALAKLLRPYRIRSRTVRLDGGDTPKGFLREQFEPAFSRYLAPKTPQRHNPHGDWENPAFASATADPLWRNEIGRKPAPEAGCGAVADREPHIGAGEALGACPTCSTALVLNRHGMPYCTTCARTVAA